MERQASKVDVDHLTREHGISSKAIPPLQPGRTREANRNLSLYYEMMHAADHSQRDCGHNH